MKNINTIFIIICFILSIGCTPNEKSLYDIIDKSLQQAKPTLLFVSNPSLGNYKHFNSILKDEQVQKVLTNFHFVEQKISAIDEIHRLLYTHRHNFFLILNADSIVSVVPTFYSKKKLISFLESFADSTFAETIKEISLLNYKDSIAVANAINNVLRSNYHIQKGNMSKTVYIDNIQQSINEMPYFYNRYLLAMSTSDFVNTEWIDSLKTNEKNIYEDCIKALKQKMFHIPHNNHSKISFKHEAIDLGEVRINEKDSCLFTFINRGDTPAIIYKVKSTCGCTVAEWAKTPIQKGDSSHIKIVFKGESNGFFKKRIKVFTNSDNPETTLTISGTVIF